jgi:hypothetical protein
MDRASQTFSRTLFKGCDAVKAFYNASSQSGGELYHR